MIIRGIRSQSRLKGCRHKEAGQTIQILKEENKTLRLDVLKLQKRLMEAQEGKTKYKTKYRQAKLKMDILGLVGYWKGSPKRNDDYEYSPKIKETRIKTVNNDDYHSMIKYGLVQSQLEENIPTKPYISEVDDFHGNFIAQRNFTPATTARETDNQREESKMLQSLLKIHDQLEKLSAQIEEKMKINSNIATVEGEIYRKMQQVVQRLHDMQVRDLERQRFRLSKEKDRTNKKYNSSLKAVQQIGKHLLQFKIEE